MFRTDFSRRGGVALLAGVWAITLLVTAFVPAEAAESSVREGDATTVPHVSVAVEHPATSASELVEGPDGPESVNDFNALATEFEELYRSEFAVARMSPDLGGGTIWFRGEVPDGAAKRVRDVPNVVAVGGAGYSNAELEEFSSRLLDAVSDAVRDSGATAALVPDHDALTITVTVGPATRGGRVAADAGPAAAEFLAAHPAPGPFVVELGTSETPVARLEAYDGGR